MATSKNPRRALARMSGAAGLLAVAATSCSTLDVVRTFNENPHGTLGDPALTPEKSATRLVSLMVREEMTGAYFHGGEELSGWCDWARDHAVALVRPPTHGDAPPASTPSASADAAEARAQHVRRFGTRHFTDVRASFKEGAKAAPWRTTSNAGLKVCDGTKISADAQRLADAVRFETSFARVIAKAKSWCQEGLVECNGPGSSLEKGMREGFDRTKGYLANRKWHREPDRANVGLVVSGGASNGMFSAGAVWLLLQVVNGCLAEPGCGDRRFRLISGTSAGSMVASVVDLFNAQYEDAAGKLRANAPGGKAVLSQLTQWFTCLPAQQLYCAESGASLGLVTSRTGIARFDGVRWLMGRAVSQEMLTNTSELFLNTVDFETGMMLSPSDQDPADTACPCDLVEHALSSIPEPLIAKPIPALRLDGFPGQAPGGASRGFFLDGGVRSVVPLMPLIRHGAERVVLVSSGPSVVSGAPPPQNGLDLLKRYIDISVGGSGSDGVALATAYAEIQGAREQDTCVDFFGAGQCLTPPCSTFCAGDIEQACLPPPPKPAVTSSSGETAKTDPQMIAMNRVFPMIEIYRNEARVDPAEGYSFNPRESFPLFLAGMAAVRERCLDLAYLLGIPASMSEKVKLWCNTPMPSQTTRCNGATVPIPDVASQDPSTVRVCDDDKYWKNNPPACLEASPTSCPHGGP